MAICGVILSKLERPRNDIDNLHSFISFFLAKVKDNIRMRFTIALTVRLRNCQCMKILIQALPKCY